MESKRTGTLNRRINTALLILVGAVLFLAAFQKQRWDTDILWALKSGEWIVQNLSVPATDPFSYTFGGRPWIDFTWGFQLITHTLYSFGGWFALFVMQLAVTSLTLFVVNRNLKLLVGARPWLSTLLLYFVLVCSLSRFFIRPHIFAFLFIALYFYLFDLYERKGDRRSLYVLLALQVLWVNIHSSFVLGIFIAGAYAAGAFIDEARRGGLRADLSERLKTFIGVSLLLTAASFINPYGWELALFPFVHQGGENADALRHIAEWTRLSFEQLFLYFYPFPLDIFILKLMTFSILFLMIMTRARLKARDVILFAAALYMASTHVRWVTVFAYFTVGLLASNAAGYLDSRPRAPRRLGPAVVALNIVLSLVLVHPYTKDPSRYGIGIKNGVYPEASVAFIKRKGVGGNIYNEYVYGGYLIFNDINVFIDGRTPTVYSSYFFWTSRLAERPKRWARLVEEYAIDHALVKTTEGFCATLWKDEQWVPVTFDDVSALFLKAGTIHDETISRWALEVLNPCDNASRYELPEGELELKRMRDEAGRVLAFHREAGLGDRVARAYRLMGLAATELGADYLPKAVEELNRAVEIDNNPATHYDLGLALGKLKRYDEALGAFKRAAKGINKGYLAVGHTYYDLGDHGSAVEYLEKYIRLLDDESERSAYNTLGLSCFELKRYDCAVRNFRRAAFMTDGAKELAEVYYRLANAYFETGDYEAGVRYYSKAMEAEPEYREVIKALSEDLRELGRAYQSAVILRLIEATE
jgi:tetratricopeptide (TPR) repeat protein